MFDRRKILITLGFTFFIIGCGTLTKNESKQANPIRIGIQNSTIVSLILIAQKEGYFEDQGLRVELVSYPSGKLALLGLKEGEVDAATVADMPLMAFGPDIPSKIIGVIADTRNGAWITARRDAGIEHPEDLAGKKIGTQKNSAVHFFLDMFLLKHELEPGKDCDVKFLPAEELPSALEKGQIDAFSMRNPFSNEAKALLGDDVIIEFYSDVYLQHFCLTIRDDWFPENPELKTSLLEALHRAGELIAKNKGVAIELVVDYLGEARRPEILRDWKNVNIGHVTLGQNLILTLEQEAVWFQDTKESQDSARFNYLKIIDTTPLKTVHPKAVQLIK